ncbi:MAG: M23 family metallopeptidase [Alistipes sp.]|nr:M23 family metallopeptidase [Alistipes sp.]
MKGINSLITWCRNLGRKHRISISDPESKSERWHTHLSPLGMVTVSIAIVSIVFATLLLLVAYTPLLDLLPGYRTDASKSRETLIRNLIRIDSLERKMNDMLIYNENRILVVDGKTPAMRSVALDSVRQHRGIVPPSQADSLLRRELEADGPYALNKQQSVRSNINAIKPMEGIISERFNAKIGLYGIRMAGAPEAPISAIAGGTATIVDWQPDRGHTIGIQHDNGMLSIYRNLSSTIVAKGQRLATGEVIGYSSVEEKSDEMFEFELWNNSKPLNPESYIVF